MNFLRTLIRVVVVAAALLLVCLVVGLNQLNRIFLQEPKADTQPIVFEIKEGESFQTVAKHLQSEGLIGSALWFRAAAEVAGLTDDVKQGIYELKPGSSYAWVLAVITTSITSDVSVTVPEGYTLDQIGEVVNDKLGITKADWEKATGMSSSFEAHPFVVRAKKPDNVDLEGYLFPDTYRFFPDATADDVVKKMLDAMETKVNALAAPTGDAKDMSTHEILTLASIVEREVRKPSEMKEVADIFLKRLDAGIALQADSTVNYVTGGDDPSINAHDRNIDSLYNTYKYRGLTPGPISNPGLNALTAVIHPASNPYYYFLTDKEGNVYYARTLEEHGVNRVKYLE